MELPSTLPETDTTYYAKYVPNTSEQKQYKIIYEFNLGALAHGGEITPTFGAAGETVTLKDGRDYYVGGHKFLGWLTESKYTYDENKPFEPYLAGDEFVMQESDVTLYAQWASAYTNANDSDDESVIYVFEPLIDHGSGAAIYVSAGNPDKLGFVASSANTASGYSEFTFYYEDGEFIGRLYGDMTYAVASSEAGQYLYYDYITEKRGGAYLALDGFGYAVYIEQLGSQTAVRASGLYEYNEKYDDYTFAYVDGNNESGMLYFALTDDVPAGTEFAGQFLLQGYESGSYMLYDNGELYDTVLMLNGYGYANVYVYDLNSDDMIKISSGRYSGTQDYEDHYGEWRYVQTSGEYGSFAFIVSALNSGSDSVAIYIEYNGDVAGTLNAASGDGTLYLDGYGSAMYSANGITYVGECVVSESGKLVTFVPYGEDEDGNIIAYGTMYFNTDFTTRTFTMNTDGFVMDGDVLTDYRGDAQMVEIPDTVKTVGTNAFNYVNTGVSLVSVVIPATVTSIEARAFQNNYTLRRAVFLSETPIQIDFSSGNSPFRWPAGDFVIVVPEGTQEAYRSAWNDCPYAIKGSEEVTKLPEFEITEDGTLVRYNKQPGSAELLDIKLPDAVVKIADNVFIGADYLRSIDLNNVTEIGETAFYGCANLVTVKFTHVTTVGDGAFADCIKLNSSGNPDVLTLPAAVSLGESAFAGCTSLRRVEFGDKIENIGAMAFVECQIYEDDPPLFVVISGDDIPALGERIFAGNIAFRIEIKNISVALKCFAAGDWNSYCGHLYIPSGDEAGKYISGSETLELDGRAVYQSSETWLYAIDGETITFYSYDSESSTYITFAGTISDDVIVVKVRGVGADRTFAKNAGNATYTTADGKYTLECDPSVLDPENYEGFSGYADVLFNGKSVKLYIRGYNTKTIGGYIDDDGLMYTVNISFDGETMAVKLVRDELIADIRAADGSVLNIHYSGNSVYVYGSFKIKVAENADGSDKYLSFTEISGITATVQDNTYSFTFKYLETSYNITATVSPDNATFTYTYRTKKSRFRRKIGNLKGI